MKNLLTGLVIGALSSSAFATTWTVDDDGKADFYNIQAAVDAASNGDEIVVMPGTYIGTGNEVVDMLGKAIHLHSSEGAVVTIIDGEDTRRVINCSNGETSNTIIKGFTITNGSANSGGGIANYNSSPTVTDCTFTSNIANYGGGMYNYISNPTMTDCTFTGNTAYDGGGMYNYNGTSATLENCTFDNNTAYHDGGGMYNYNSATTLTDCAFENNSAKYGGGMLNWDNSSPTLENCTFTDNDADYYGGCMYNTLSSTPMLTSTTVCGNTPNQIYPTGSWTDIGGNCIAASCNDGNDDGIPDECGCPDINGDGIVNVSELLAIIGQWGLTNSPADVNQDGIVDVSDLLEVVGNWGPCE